MKRLLVGGAPFAVVVAVYFAVVALSSPDKAGDTGSPTTLTPSSTTTSTVGSAPGEGWDALPSHSEVEVHAYAAVLAAIPVPHEPSVVTAPATPVPAPATPVPAPDPTPVRDGGSIEQLICSYSWDCATALRVAHCESRLTQTAVSSGGGNLGLFQVNTIHRSRWEAMGYSQADMLTAGPNVAVAYSLWSEQGWRPWSCR